MAKTQTETDAEPTMATVMDRMAAILERQAENAPRRVLEFGDPEYQQQLRDEGFFDTFPKPVYQNGREAVPRGLSQQTRERASSLRAGKYWGGKLTVTVDHRDHVHLSYKSSTPDDRMKQPWKDFPDMIDHIWNEMHQAPVVA